ncbi:MAG: class I SAM-dependent methyltransferase [Novosphingobium sp.]
MIAAARSFTPAAGKLAGSRNTTCWYACWRARAPGDRCCSTASIRSRARPTWKWAAAPEPSPSPSGSARPGARIIAIDPDEAALAIARTKADRAGVGIDFRTGFLDQQSIPAGSVDGIYCSLVLHQVPVATKSQIIEQMRGLTAADGLLHVADYAAQRGLMRQLFRLTVQMTDGRADTQPNADGLLEQVLTSSEFDAHGLDRRIDTPTGTITLFSRRPRRT